MKKFRIAYDDNLGLPEGFLDDLNNSFNGDSKIHFQVEAFHDIGEMIKAFDRREIALAFLPAGSLPYLRSNYGVLAEASFGAFRSEALSSILRTRLADSRISLEELSSRRLGCVNHYCTTSYWAPMILLSANVSTPRPTIDFVQLDGFDDMIAAVVDGRIDGAMIWEAVMEHHPEFAGVLSKGVGINHLPAPLLIGNELLEEETSTGVKLLTANYQSTKWHGYFKALKASDIARLQRFEEGVIHAKKVFGLSI
jgi:hypothetical protein